MFCLVTDLMDWEEYPAPELAALYKWRWDGSETALREAKAPLRGAGPGTGPMLRSGSPALVRQELAAWAAATGLTRGVTRDAALAAVPAGKGRRAGLAVRLRDLSHARAVRAVLSAIRLGNDCYQAVTSEIAECRNVVDRDRHRARKSSPPRPSRTRERKTPSPVSPPPSSPWPTPRPDQQKHRKPARKNKNPPDRGPGRPALCRTPACPPEGNYPQ